MSESGSGQQAEVSDAGRVQEESDEITARMPASVWAWWKEVGHVLKRAADDCGLTEQGVFVATRDVPKLCDRARESAKHLERARTAESSLKSLGLPNSDANLIAYGEGGEPALPRPGTTPSEGAPPELSPEVLTVYLTAARGEIARLREACIRKKGVDVLKCAICDKTNIVWHEGTSRTVAEVQHDSECALAAKGGA